MDGDGSKEGAVLVTGGNGFLGQHIIKILHEFCKDDVQEIRILDIEPYTRKLDFTEEIPVKVFVGDVCSASDVQDALTAGDQKVTTVIHSAGLVSFGTAPDMAGMERVNVEGTRNVVAQCEQTDVRRLVFTSTVDVAVGYEEINQGQEMNTPTPATFLFPGYPATKHRAELVVLDKHSESNDGLHTVALRPSVMYGELDPFYVTSSLRAAKERGGVLHRVGSGDSFFQQCYVGNAAWAHVVAMRTLREKPQEVGGLFYYINDDTPTMNGFDFMKPFLEARGYSLSARRLPYFLVYGLLSLRDVFLWAASSFYSPGNLQPSRLSVRYICTTYTFSSSRARAEMLYKPVYDYRTSLSKALSWYKHCPL